MEEEIVKVGSNNKVEKIISVGVSERVDQHKVSTEFFEKKSIGDILKTCALDVITGIVCELFGICIPVVGPIINSALKRMNDEIAKKT